jgi:hypothetical protein
VRNKYAPTGKLPLCLPIDSPFKVNYGRGLKDIQRIVPRFIPKQGLSFFPISEAEYIDLEKKLIING